MSPANNLQKELKMQNVVQSRVNKYYIVVVV
jgi:hypothetical protein